MIDVLIHKNNSYIYKAVISGHANYSEEGFDIVCSAVSVLVINTVNTIEKLTNAKMEVKQKDGLIEIKLAQYNEKAELFMKSLEIGIKSIVENYGNYVKLSYRR